MLKPIKKTQSIKKEHATEQMYALPRLPSIITPPVTTHLPILAPEPVRLPTPAPIIAPNYQAPVLLTPAPESNSIKAPPTQRTTTTTNRIITGRLALDDALKQVENSQNDDRAAFEGWSDARLRAYKMIDKNPNSYYYRFNAPGEQQKKGKWSDEENALFLSRLAELGANSQWGIFSIAIPGRVGYQVIIAC